MNKPDVTRFLLRFAAFLLLLGVPFAAELLVVPIDAFTFRCWEALSVHAFRDELPGPFYPRRRLERLEAGDLGHHTEWEIRRRVEWITDEWGYRKRPTARSVDVVIVGDSNVVGSSLTQDDTPAEVLGALTGLEVYPLAPATMREWALSDRWLPSREAPRVVVLESLERRITSLAPVGDLGGVPLRRVTAARDRPAWQQGIFVLADRAKKQNMVSYLRARVGFARGDGIPSDHGVLWQSGDAANAHVSDASIERAARTIAGYRDFVEARGARFVFLPVPNKESTCWEWLPSRRPSDFLPRLHERLLAMGVEAVDTNALFRGEWERSGQLLHQEDDSHWNARGVRLATGALAPMLSPR